LLALLCFILSPTKVKQPFLFVAQAKQITATATMTVWLVPSVRGPAYFAVLESSVSQSRMLSVSSMDWLVAQSIAGLRGTLSSGPKPKRLSFSTDLLELDVIFGGEKNWKKPFLSSSRKDCLWSLKTGKIR